MRKMTLLVATLFVAFSMQAQITFEASDYTYNSSGGDSIFYWGFDKTQVILPQFGADMTWDYTTTPLDGLNYYTTFEAATHPDFPTANLRQPSKLSYLGILFPTYEYFTYDNTGLFYNGKIDPSLNLPLGGVTGNPADTLRVVGGTRIVTEPTPYVTFPLNYGDVSNLVGYADINFVADIPSFGLNNFLVRQNIKRVINSEVNGWGKLALLNPNSQTVDTFEVLFYHQIITRIDSFYDANNNPLPESLLNPLGFSQGDSAVHKHYNFFVPGVDYFATYFYTLNGVIESALLNKSVFTLGTPLNTSKITINSIAHRVYPNPIQNHQFQLEIDKNNAENWQLDIYNIMGQTVHNELIIDNVSTIQLEDNLPTGQYFYRVRNEEGQTVVNGKLINQ